MAKQARLSRRQFLTGSALGAVALGAGTPLARAAESASGAPSGPVPRGVWKVTDSIPILKSPAHVPAGETWRYQLCYPFQVAPRLAGLSLSFKPTPGPGQDFPGGVDFFLFSDPARIRAEDAIPFVRNHLEANPHAGGKMAIMAKYPAQIGFIPFGAKRADGSPHPHAGTGVAIGSAGARPTDDSEGVDNFPDRVGRGAYRGSRAYYYIEIHQLSYDGSSFRFSDEERWKDGLVLDGYRFTNSGLCTGIPDGDDLLIPMQAIRVGAAKGVSGITRWQRREGKWRPASFVAITPEDNSIEPSIVRDLDGSLLFFGRGRRDAGGLVRVWRQAPGESAWTLVLTRRGITNSTPVTLNRAVDGTPYLLMNLYQPEFKLPPGVYSDGGISRLEPKGWRGERSTICLWQLNVRRDRLESPIIAKDPLVDFGVPPRGTIWAADHPCASVVQLGDGAWHSLFGYRILEWIENSHQLGPTPQTGTYLGEAVSFGPPVPSWNF